MPDPATRHPGLAARSALVLLSPWSRLGLLLVLLASAATTVLLQEPQRLLTDGGWPQQMSGLAAPLLFVLVYGICTAALAPRPVLNLAAGALFGAQTGTLSALGGTVLAAGLSFGLGRLLGQDALRPLLRGRWLASADQQLSRHAFRSVLIMRLIPGVPFAVSNYGSAVSQMRWLPFLGATGLGSVPNTGAYAVAGSQAATPSSPAFLASAAFIVLSGLGAAVFAWRRRGRLAPGGRLARLLRRHPSGPTPTSTPDDPPDPDGAATGRPVERAGPVTATRTTAGRRSGTTGRPHQRQPSDYHRDEHLPSCLGLKH